MINKIKIIDIKHFKDWNKNEPVIIKTGLKKFTDASQIFNHQNDTFKKNLQELDNILKIDINQRKYNRDSNFLEYNDVFQLMGTTDKIKGKIDDEIFNNINELGTTSRYEVRITNNQYSVPLHIDSMNTIIYQILGSTMITLIHSDTMIDEFKYEYRNVFKQLPSVHPGNNIHYYYISGYNFNPMQIKTKDKINIKIKAGEMLYYPPYWGHYYESTNYNCTINFNFDDIDK
ncbi:Cupin-like domain [seawater metagenome]|uniref:Cupin-like domain n=1 Tax=seawater metagenome TaxID=1561972 RepID=A0A5E8CL31_9ZZZZ